MKYSDGVWWLPCVGCEKQTNKKLSKILQNKFIGYFRPSLKNRGEALRRHSFSIFLASENQILGKNTVSYFVGNKFQGEKILPKSWQFSLYNYTACEGAFSFKWMF